MQVNGITKLCKLHAKLFLILRHLKWHATVRDVLLAIHQPDPKNTKVGGWLWEITTKQTSDIMIHEYIKPWHSEQIQLLTTSVAFYMCFLPVYGCRNNHKKEPTKKQYHTELIPLIIGSSDWSTQQISNGCLLVRHILRCRKISSTLRRITR